MKIRQSTEAWPLLAASELSRTHAFQISGASPTADSVGCFASGLHAEKRVGHSLEFQMYVKNIQQTGGSNPFAFKNRHFRP